jgi:hypothetical protein
MILNDLEFAERKDRAAGTMLGLLVGDALGRFAKYLLDMEGKSLSTEKFIKRLSDVKDLTSVPVSMEAVQIIDIAQELQKCLKEVQKIVSEGHLNADNIHPDKEMLDRAEAFILKIDNPYREDPIPKELKEPSINSWNDLSRLLASVIPVSILAAGDNFSSLFYYEKLINWVNKDMQIHTKSVTVCQAALLLAQIIAISCRKLAADKEQIHKRHYYIEQLVWGSPGLDPYLFHVLDFENYIDDPVFNHIRRAESIVSLANAYSQYYRVDNFKDGLIETITKGGDIQGNAAICGAVLGAVFGKAGIPKEWLPAEKVKTKEALYKANKPPESRMRHYVVSNEDESESESDSDSFSDDEQKGKSRSSIKEKSSAKVDEKTAEVVRKVKERNQDKLYHDAEEAAISLLFSPVPERDYIDTLKNKIELINSKNVSHKGKSPSSEVEAEAIVNLLKDKFIDRRFEENKWKYPILKGNNEYTSYSFYEMATFATFVTAPKDKKSIMDMAKDGMLNIIVDRLNELYDNSHKK